MVSGAAAVRPHSRLAVKSRRPGRCVEPTFFHSAALSFCPLDHQKVCSKQRKQSLGDRELWPRALVAKRTFEPDTPRAAASSIPPAVQDSAKLIKRDQGPGRGRRFLPATSPQPESKSQPGAMRVFLISDIHTDYEENLDWIRNLSPTSFLNDALIVAGDVSDSVPIFEETLRILRPKFAHVFFTPGNHDLWLRTNGGSAPNPAPNADPKPVSTPTSALTTPSTVNGSGSGSVDSHTQLLNEASARAAVTGTSPEPTTKPPSEDSVTKLAVLFKICEELGVDTRPKFLKPSAGGGRERGESGQGLESGVASSEERRAASLDPGSVRGRRDEVQGGGGGFRSGSQELPKRAAETSGFREGGDGAGNRSEHPASTVLSVGDRNEETGGEVAGGSQNETMGAKRTGENKLTDGEVGSSAVPASSAVEPDVGSTRVEDQGDELRNSPRAEVAGGENTSREPIQNTAQQGKEKAEGYSVRAQERKSVGEKVEGRRQEAGAALFSTDPEEWLRSQTAGIGGEENGTKAGSNGMEAGNNETREGERRNEGGENGTRTGGNGTGNGKNGTREGTGATPEGENGAGVSSCETGGDSGKSGEANGAEQGSSGVWIVPILSWHHISFDTEPDIPGYNIPAIEKVAKDYKVCKWPPGWDARTESVARAFDAMNADLHRGFDPAATPGCHVITFSHFLPRLELIPEKRFLFYPNLAKAVGSHALEARVRAIHAAAGSAPGCHLFGHTHFSWDMTLEGMRYIQAPLAYPRERKRRMNGGDDWLPLCVYDSSRGGVLTSENRCHWSDYYKTHAREPENFEFAPWVANLWKPIRKPAGDA